MVQEARETLQANAVVAAKEQLFRQREAFETSLESTRKQLQAIESRCRLREDALDGRVEAFDNREREIAAREALLKAEQAKFETRGAEFERTHQRQLRELEKISGMRREEAEHMLLDRMERSFQSEAEDVMARAEETLQVDLERRARDTLLASMERLAASHATEALVTTVPLASDELKGLALQQLCEWEGHKLLVELSFVPNKQTTRRPANQLVR